ncbi:MAG: hypothetical protein EBU57_01540 [Alphaproteobacteria bacterium]|nr:hypothetical protein [Alphaproteobacteria bacterium]
MDLDATNERVRLLMNNSADMATDMFAAHAARAQTVPINPLHTARQAKLILDDTAPVDAINDTGCADLIETLGNTGELISADGTKFIQPIQTSSPGYSRCCLPARNRRSALCAPGRSQGCSTGQTR